MDSVLGELDLGSVSAAVTIDECTDEASSGNRHNNTQEYNFRPPF
jgi:hypothetical protein